MKCERGFDLADQKKSKTTIKITNKINNNDSSNFRGNAFSFKRYSGWRKKNVVFSIYLQKITFVKKTRMEGTQTCTTAASLSAVPMVSLDKGLVLLV